MAVKRCISSNISQTSCQHNIPHGYKFENIIETRKMCSRINMQTHASPHRNPILTLTFWPHGQCIPLLSLVSIAQAVFLLEHKQMDKQTDRTDRPAQATHRSSTLVMYLSAVLHYYYYNHFTALWISSGTTRVSWHQKGKTRKVKVPIWIYWSKRVSDSGSSWAICKSAPRSRQITMTASHHSVFTGRMPSCRPINSVKGLEA